MYIFSQRVFHSGPVLMNSVVLLELGQTHEELVPSLLPGRQVLLVTGNQLTHLLQSTAMDTHQRTEAFQVTWHDHWWSRWSFFMHQVMWILYCTPSIHPSIHEWIQDGVMEMESVSPTTIQETAWWGGPVTTLSFSWITELFNPSLSKNPATFWGKFISVACIDNLILSITTTGHNQTRWNADLSVNQKLYLSAEAGNISIIVLPQSICLFPALIYPYF